MKGVTIYTDGACSGNPGEGGWCAILMYKQREKVVSGYNKYTTNNRMELFSVIIAYNTAYKRVVRASYCHALNVFVPFQHRVDIRPYDVETAEMLLYFFGKHLLRGQNDFVRAVFCRDCST